MHLASANTDDGARLDIAADGFWRSASQRTFFDVRVFNPLAPSNNHVNCYRKHEQGLTPRELETSNILFTPLVLSATGGFGSEAKVSDLVIHESAIN